MILVLEDEATMISLFLNYIFYRKADVIRSGQEYFIRDESESCLFFAGLLNSNQSSSGAM